MSTINPSFFTTRPEIVGTFGVAATTHWIATAVAMGILERGGNAFDAGIAAAFTLLVVEPHLNGPGGDVPGQIGLDGNIACHFGLHVGGAWITLRKAGLFYVCSE